MPGPGWVRILNSFLPTVPCHSRGLRSKTAAANSPTSDLTCGEEEEEDETLCPRSATRFGSRRAMLPFRSLLGDESDQEERPLLSSNGTLSPLQKMYAFAICLVVGFAFILLSFLVFFKPVKFAIFFTLGNLIAIGSTVFLIGPGEQARMMFDPVRIYATVVYLGSVITALICALLINSQILTLLALIIECCALSWYSLSYVPFARRIVSELLIRTCDTEI